MVNVKKTTEKNKKTTKKVAKITKVKYSEIVKAPYSDGAITRDDFPGFKEDYLAIHSIL